MVGSPFDRTGPVNVLSNDMRKALVKNAKPLDAPTLDEVWSGVILHTAIKTVKVLRTTEGAPFAPDWLGQLRQRWLALPDVPDDINGWLSTELGRLQDDEEERRKGREPNSGDETKTA